MIILCSEEPMDTSENDAEAAGNIASNSSDSSFEVLNEPPESDKKAKFSSEEEGM